MRRRLTATAFALPFVAVSVLGTGLAANATKPTSDGEHKVAFCHATHSEKNPYVPIETDKIAVIMAHFKHQDEEDIWPAFTYVNDEGVEVEYPGSPGSADFNFDDCTDGGSNS